jgi:hypothetical protein
VAVTGLQNTGKTTRMAHILLMLTYLNKDFIQPAAHTIWFSHHVNRREHIRRAALPPVAFIANRQPTAAWGFSTAYMMQVLEPKKNVHLRQERQRHRLLRLAQSPLKHPPTKFHGFKFEVCGCG